MAEFLNRWRVRRAQESFEAQLAPHVDHMYRLAVRFTGNQHSAEDLVQDVLIKVYRMRAQFTDIEQPRPWLARVLYREFVDRWRREKHAPVSFSTLESEEMKDHQETVADQGYTPEQAASSMELQQQLTEALAKLNEDQRSLILFHDVEGYTLEELSVVMSVPIGTVKSRIHRARARLREILSGTEGTFQSADSFSISV